MTTITAPTTPRGHLANSWRFVATFVAGAALAAGLAVGVGVGNDHASAPSSRSQNVVQVQPSAPDSGCRQHRGPC